VVCGRPLPNLRPGHRHQACWEKEVAQQLNAWVPRAKALLAKGWTIGRVADELGVTAKRVREALPGHSRSAEVRVAESDARLRSFVRQVKAGCSVLEAGRRVGYAPNTARNARARAARKGLS
jgi:hypothetical protein